MSTPSIFISYSHEDESWKDRLVGQLKVLELEGELEVWDDRRIAAGDEWLPEIERAIEDAAAAVLLISQPFLTSNFIRGTEVPRLLGRRRSNGLLIIPLILSPCAWDRVAWVAALQCRPVDGKPLSRMRKTMADQALCDLAKEAHDLLRAGSPGAGTGTPRSTTTADVDARAADVERFPCS